MKILIPSPIRCILTFLAATILMVSSAVAQPANKIYELRTYSINPGKMSDALLRLSRAKALFEEHGMTVVAYWTLEPEGDDDTIIYLLGHDDRDAARASWQGFHGDPAWHKLYRDSIANGSLLSGIQSQFMNPADFSPLK